MASDGRPLKALLAAARGALAHLHLPVAGSDSKQPREPSCLLHFHTNFFHRPLRSFSRCFRDGGKRRKPKRGGASSPNRTRYCSASGSGRLRFRGGGRCSNCSVSGSGRLRFQGGGRTGSGKESWCNRGNTPDSGGSPSSPGSGTPRQLPTFGDFFSSTLQKRKDKGKAPAAEDPPTPQPPEANDFLGAVLKQGAMEQHPGAMKSKQASTTRADDEVMSYFVGFLESKPRSFVVKVEFKVGSSASLATVEVDYKQLVAFDQEFAIILCNRSIRIQDKLSQAVESLLLANNFWQPDGRIPQIASVSFTGMPKWIRRFEDYLSKKDLVETLLLFSGEEDKAKQIWVCVLTPEGRRRLRAILILIVECHRNGKTFGGEFEFRDIIVDDSKHIKFFKEPQTLGPGDKVKDFAKIDTLFMPKYFDTEMMKSPVFTTEFRADLVDLSIIEKEWYGEYIINHPFLASSRARGAFTNGVNKGLSGVRDDLWDRLNTAPYHWLPRSRASPSSLVQGVLDPAASALIEEVIDHRNDKIKAANFAKPHETTAKPVKPIKPYVPTHLSAIDCSRNLDEHGLQYRRIKDLDEVEIFCAYKFSQSLPFIIKSLLQADEFETKFMTVWSAYKASASDGHRALEGLKGARVKQRQ